MWSEIRAEVPDAELRIFYGWTVFDKMLSGNPASMAWKDKVNKLMEQDGITHLGKISHGAVQVEYESAGIHAYPTHFGEISCISCMKSQAFGAVPVVINYAALQETVQHGIKVEGDIYEPEVKEKYKQELIALLKDEKRQEEIRKPMMKWAKKQFPWSKVAASWSKEFKSQPSDLDKQVDELMENNQSLDAWNLVKDTDYPKKDKVYAKVRHAFEPEEYTKFYAEHLSEAPVSEEVALDCTKLAPRFKWVVEEIEKQKPEEVLDLGCADGYLCLTLAKRGFDSIGVNLYKPSIERAGELAVKHKLNAKFLCDDLFNAQGSYDAVVLFEVLEHLPDPKKAIDHCMSLLTENGSFYLSTPSPEHIGIQMHKDEPNHKKWDEDGTPSGHLKLYNEAELKDMLKDYKIKQLFLDEEKCWLGEVTK